MKRALTVEIGGSRLDAFLARSLSGYTRAFLKGLVEAGRVTVDGVRRDADARVSEGQKVLVDLPEAPSKTADLDAWVLAENEHFLVLNKPAGLLMHPLGSSWLARPEAALADEENLAALLQARRPAILRAGTPRCGIVHRLDRPTSGVLVVAKDPQTWTALCRAFREREMDKTYRAIVRGVVAGAARVQAPIGRAPGSRRIVVTSLGKSAETGLRAVSKKKTATLVEAKPLTGRTHQIRAHLAHIGHPVAGDAEFDAPSPDIPVAPRLMLHAYRLGFFRPSDGKRAEFTADPPKDFASYWRSLS